MRYDENEHERAVRLRNNATPLGGLFEIQHPAPSVPNSSSEAAADRLTFSKGGRASRASQNMALLLLICSRESGYTRDELDAETHFGAPSICARVKLDLIPLYVVESQTDTRKTRKGMSAKVLYPTEFGRKRVAAAA